MNGKKCKIINKETIVESHKDNHTALEETEILKMEFKNAIKLRVRCENVPIQKIYQEEQTIKKISDMDKVAMCVPQYISIQSGLYKEKAKHFPPIPSSLDDIVLSDELTICEDNKRKFLLYHDKKMIIFCSDIGFKILTQATRWQCDGTFKCVPD